LLPKNASNSILWTPILTPASSTLFYVREKSTNDNSPSLRANEGLEVEEFKLDFQNADLNEEIDRLF
jgi:hypothetical protein